MRPIDLLLRRAAGRCFWALLISAAVSTSGCGGCGCSSSAEREMARLGKRMTVEKAVTPEDEKAAAEKADAQKAATREARAKAARRSQQEERNLPQAPLPMELQPRELSPPPENLAAWKAQDFLDARLLGDLRFTEAVALLGERFADDPRTVDLLCRLLPPVTPEEMAEVALPTGYRGSRAGRVTAAGASRRPLGAVASGGAASLAVIAAIGANRTPQAVEVLGKILAGQIAGAEGLDAAEAAMQAMIDHPSPEREHILWQLLTQPEQVRPPGRSGVDPTELSKTALRLVQSGVSASLRLRVAEYLADPTTTRSPGDPIGEFLAARHPANVAAQGVLYRCLEVTETTKESFEGHFRDYSSAALGHALGIPAGAQPSQSGAASGSAGYRPPPKWSTAAQPAREAAPVALDRAEALNLAGSLWAEPLVSAVGQRIDRVPSLRESRPPVLLAATMPVDGARAALHRALHRYWQDGPGHLEAAGLPGGWVSDPALLVFVKGLPRRVPDAGRARPAAQREGDEAEAAWMKFSHDLVRAWCRWMHAAAVERKREARRTGVKRPDDDTPVEPIELPPDFSLHEAAHVVDAFDVDWPEAAPSELGGAALGALKVRYLRLEETTQPVRLLPHYRRQMKSPQQPTPIPGGVWLDRLSDVGEASGKLSIDVLVTRGDDRPDAPYRETDSLRLLVEILSIEVALPE